MAWDLSIPENRKRYNALKRALYHKNKDKHVIYRRKSHLKTLYDLTPEEHKKMYDSQDGKCAICGKSGKLLGRKGGLRIDHDHETMNIRGLLCERCNLCLERFENVKDFGEKAVAYLSKRPFKIRKIV